MFAKVYGIVTRSALAVIASFSEDCCPRSGAVGAF
jgi:hypothetical protein